MDEPLSIPWGSFLLIIPAVLAFAALKTGNLGFKMAVPLSCMAVILLFRPEPAAVWIMAAFFFSAAGDGFLSSKGEADLPFVVGILFYLLAHAGYLGYALSSGGTGGISWMRMGIALALFLVPYLIYYGTQLRPSVGNPVLAAAALVYLILSCAVLAAALGRRAEILPFILFAAGILLIVVSDTVISLTEFLSYHRLNGLILPTYYGAQLMVTAAVLMSRSPG